MALITVLISIIWLFQSIRLLEFVVDKGASGWRILFDVGIGDAAMVDDYRADFRFYRS
jgi:hypothetical protein